VRRAREDVARAPDQVAIVAGPRKESSSTSPAQGPNSPRLSEVLVVAGQADVAGDIQKACDACRAVEEEAPEILGSLQKLRLQEVVHDHRRVVQIREEIADALPREIRHDLDVTLATGRSR